MARLSPLFTWRGAIADSGLPATTRHVALTLSLHMNERGGSAFPSHATLARESGLSDRAVGEHLRKLRDEGWLSVVSCLGKVNTYSAIVPDDLGSTFLPTSEPHAATSEPHRVNPGTTFRQGRNEDVLQDVPSQSEAPIHELIAYYCDTYAASHRGNKPPQQFVKGCAQQTKRLLSEGYPPDDLRGCLYAIANENKHPSRLPFMLADYHSEVQRGRQVRPEVTRPAQRILND